MSGGMVVQYAIVAIVVALSLYTAVGVFARRLRARLLHALGDWMAMDTHASWMRSLGRRLADTRRREAGCGSGCSSCEGCGAAATPDRPNSSNVAEPQVLRFSPQAGRNGQRRHN